MINALRVLKLLALTVATLLALAALTLFGFLFYADKVLHDGHMHFPSKPHGTFVEPPRLADGVGGREVRWVLPRACGNNAYQAVTDDYEEDVRFGHWFGSRPTCVTDTATNASICAVAVSQLAAQESQMNLWFVAQGYVCGGQETDYFLSERLLVPLAELRAAASAPASASAASGFWLEPVVLPAGPDWGTVNITPIISARLLPAASEDGVIRLHMNGGMHWSFKDLDLAVTDSSERGFSVGVMDGGPTMFIEEKGSPEGTVRYYYQDAGDWVRFDASKVIGDRYPGQSITSSYVLRTGRTAGTLRLSVFGDEYVLRHAVGKDGHVAFVIADAASGPMK